MTAINILFKIMNQCTHGHTDAHIVARTNGKHKNTHQANGKYSETKIFLQIMYNT